MSWPSYLHSPERSADELERVLQRALERADHLGYHSSPRNEEETPDA